MADYALVFEDPPVLRCGHRRSRRRGQPKPDVSTYVAPESHRPHGAYAKYVVERCRCEPCRGANRAYEGRRRWALTRPDQVWVPYVPAGAAREHCRRLGAAGVGLRQITRVSGVAHGTLSKLMYGDRSRGMGPSKRIRKATADRILAVRERDLALGACVDAGPTWALIDELLAAGYRKAWIARELGQRGPGLQLSRRAVSVRHAGTVAALHARCVSEPAPARARRWVR